MTLNHLMWTLVGLTLVFGLGLAFAESDAARNLWGGLAVAALGGFALAMALDGVVQGRIRVQFNVIERTTRPRLFWAAVVLVATAGMVVWISAAWVLFFRAA